MEAQTLVWEDPLEKENGNPLLYSYLENPMDGGAWQAIQSMGSQRVGHDKQHFSVLRSEKTPGSKDSSTSGLSPRGHLERQGESHVSTQDEA